MCACVNELCALLDRQFASKAYIIYAWKVIMKEGYSIP